jgi:hypothetical protein
MEHDPEASLNRSVHWLMVLCSLKQVKRGTGFVLIIEGYFWAT